MSNQIKEQLENPIQIKSFSVNGDFYKSFNVVKKKDKYYLQVIYSNEQLDKLYYRLNDLKILDYYNHKQGLIDYFINNIRN